jgi:hypothetical protein
VTSLSPLSQDRCARAMPLHSDHVVPGYEAVVACAGDLIDVSAHGPKCQGVICRQCRLRVREVSTGVQRSFSDRYHGLSAAFRPSGLIARARASDNGDRRLEAHNPDILDCMAMSQVDATPEI